MVDSVGVEQLFNGVDLDGWEHVGPGSFSVEDGLLTSHGGMGLLWHTRRTVGDAVLRVVYRVGREEDNSGVFIRIASPPPDEWFAVHNGYEVQILATGDDWHATGCIYSMSAATARAEKPPGEWNEMNIVMSGERVEVSVNGVQVTTFESSRPVPPRTKPYEPERGPRPTHGYIGLQNHDEPSRVQFKEVSVRPLP
ncbi:MAG: DUF1080 domain-containing protein [Chloroflexi bacterium]|nr:DUF1080 domain-containing protein [Chloroflexota bacterium]